MSIADLLFLSYNWFSGIGDMCDNPLGKQGIYISAKQPCSTDLIARSRSID